MKQLLPQVRTLELQLIDKAKQEERERIVEILEEMYQEAKTFEN
jgi:hypothetical protein